jgi:predicted Rossmann fold flavoprotein
MLKTEADGRMFSITDSSQTIIDCLLKEANKYGIEILMNAEVKTVAPLGEGFSLEISGGRILPCDFVCVACGGFPKATMFGWLTATGHTIEEPVPSLFTFNMPGNSITALMGVSVEKASIKIAGTRLSEEGALLITHWGLSGPAILKLSAWGARELATKNYNFDILVNWVPSYHEQSLREQWQAIRHERSGQKIANRNPFHLPARLWLYLLQESGVTEELRWADLPGKEQNKLIKNLTAQEFSVQGKTTFKEEFVTCGGIRLAEIDANTMQSKIVPGIFFAGEIVDVDGVTGGFNFQHAWTSGWIAARAISEAAIPANTLFSTP